MLFLSVPGSQTTQDRTTTRDNVVAVLPSSLPERSRHPVRSAFRSSIARPTDTSVYASSDTSRCRLQDSRPEWIRCSPFPVGVGIVIAHDPLHGSGRADFPHPALTSANDAHAAQSIRLIYASGSQPTADQASPSVPTDVAVPAAPRERLPPEQTAP